MREAGVLESSLAIALSATRVEPETNTEVRPDDVNTFALIAQARGGDRAAFDRLMRRHERLVLMTALRFLHGNMADAQDATQMVFLRLHRSLGQFHDSERAGNFPAWLYRTTVNVCHDMNRRTRRRGEVDLDAVARVAGCVQDETALDGDRQRAAVKAGLEELGEKERAAVILRDIEGLDTAEVARILGSSEATVRSQISVARRKLRKFAEVYMRRRL